MSSAFVGLTVALAPRPLYRPLYFIFRIQDGHHLLKKPPLILPFSGSQHVSHLIKKQSYSFLVCLQH